MALSRRSGNRLQSSIWPGFVDAMTALLLVLMFVLTIFTVVQFVFRETISGQETELDSLGAQIDGLADALGLEQQRSKSLEGNVSELSSTLNDAQSQVESQLALIATLTETSDAQADELTQKRADITSFEAQVATLLSERDAALGQGQALEQQLSDLDSERQKLISDQEALQLALAKTRGEVDAQSEAARLDAARREAMEALVADMKAQALERDENLATMLTRIEGGATAVEELELQRLADAAAAQALQDRLKNADTELSAMTLALEEQRKRAEDTLTLLAAAEVARGDLDDKLSAALLAKTIADMDNKEIQQLLETAESEKQDLDKRLAAIARASSNAETDSETIQAQLAAALAAKQTAETSAKDRLSIAQERAMLLAIANQTLATTEAKSAEDQRKLALLNQQVTALRTQLGSLQALLDDSAARDATADIRLQTLGTELNTALARVAAEEKRSRELEEAERKRLEAQAKDLERYKSEFFGQLRDVLGAEQGVRIDGDRFVFSSEVLFKTGDVALSDAGKKQIASIAGILKRVSDQIPSEIDWVIRVDGHTDNQPLSGGGRYRDNWELSQARALSVVRYMSEDLGIAPRRLAANGFGEYQPINPANTPQARAQNRRIELKLTER